METRAFCLARTIAKFLYVTLSEAKGLCAESGILRFAQNDRPKSMTLQSSYLPGRQALDTQRAFWDAVNGG